MKIISDFKDYYDSVFHQYSPDEGVLIRNTTERQENCILNLGRLPTQNSYRPSNIDADKLVIGFCGTIYECLRVIWYKNSSVSYHYCEQTRKELWAEAVKHAISWGTRRDIDNVLKRHNEMKELFKTEFSFVCLDEENWERSLVFNPCLGDLEFFKELDCYSAAQEVSMWLDNKASPEPDVNIPTGDDKVLAQSKGFDKLSFRKESEGKSKRVNRKEKCN